MPPTVFQIVFFVVFSIFLVSRFRSNPRRHLTIASILLATAIMTGCGTTGDGFSGTPGGNSNGTTVQSVSATSTSIASGGNSSATVTLSAAAPSTGAQVSLTSSNMTAATVPANMTVAAGQTSSTFMVTAGTVSVDTSVQITAAYNNTVAGITVTVRASAAPPAPPPPQPPGGGTPVAITLSPATATLTSGATQQFTATVTGSSNTAVNFWASIGNISTTGMFTAPNVSASTTVTVTATAQADTTKVKTAQVTVNPVTTPPPPSGGPYSGTGPVSSWKAYQYFDTDKIYHQAILITGAKGAYPVIGYSYSDPNCTVLGDRFNDFWQPIGNGLWWFINRPEMIYVQWVWYDNPTTHNILQQTPCIDYSGAPKYN